ncbi:MAG: hypothetical protein M3033_08585, partial [Acidobacteriota bacterium]|nr:hypothetical protein [Acidobacteriota bacterium]
MKFHLFIFLLAVAVFAAVVPVSAQVDSVIGQLTSSPAESFAGGISGDGRFVVFESTGNLATENPRNSDGNREIFIFDYAQRRIFQITDTKSLLIDTTKGTSFSNIKVEIDNIRPVMSSNGRWIAFGSNATTSTPTTPNSTNPGNFDANTFTDSTGNNPLTSDGNTEMWLYQIPATAPANLSSGAEIPVTNLSAGTFIRVTNTLPSRLPVAGTTTAGPVIADDNREATINTDGNYIAFVSNRDLVPTGNASPNNNDEIFSYVRSAAKISQITQTPRGTIAAPIFNDNPSISGNGLRVAFASNADKPVAGTDGTNPDNNLEIFYTDLNADGTPDLTRPRKQITNTTRATAGQIINVFDLGRRMSLDGRYIAFDSYADLASSGSAIQTSFALYLYDTTTSTFRQIGARSNADAAASGGDIQHYPGFTDYDSSGAPQTLVFETRLNIKADGTVTATQADGLNPDVARPTQIYSYPLTAPAASATFTRLTKFPAPSVSLASTQPIPSNSVRRMTFTLALTEIGTGNIDLANEAFYFLLPTVAATQPSTTTLSFVTGASRIPVSASPVPTPTPGTTPTPSPSPTPQTPPAVFGVSPGMLAIANFTSGTAVVSQTAVGSLSRSFTLPIELSGVTVAVNGAASGIKSISQGEVVFVVPPGFAPPVGGTVYPIVINDNGTVIKGSVTVVPARPDIFTFSALPAPGGRARIFNVTNRVVRTEPFTVTTVKIKGGVRVPTVLR